MLRKGCEMSKELYLGVALTKKEWAILYALVKAAKKHAIAAALMDAYDRGPLD